MGLMDFNFAANAAEAGGAQSASHLIDKNGAIRRSLAGAGRFKMVGERLAGGPPLTPQVFKPLLLDIKLTPSMTNKRLYLASAMYNRTNYFIQLNVKLFHNGQLQCDFPHTEYQAGYVGTAFPDPAVGGQFGQSDSDVGGAFFSAFNSHHIYTEFGSPLTAIKGLESNDTAVWTFTARYTQLPATGINFHARVVMYPRVVDIVADRMVVDSVTFIADPTQPAGSGVGNVAVAMGVFETDY